MVVAGWPERAGALTARLGPYDPNGFLPHGNKRDGHGDRQPIWLTDQDENPNGASVLFLTDGAQLQTVARSAHDPPHHRDQGQRQIRQCVLVGQGTQDREVAQRRQLWEGSDRWRDLGLAINQPGTE